MRNHTRVPDRACGAPGARKRARRVREAVRGNGPADNAGTAPRTDFTIHLAPELAEFATENKEWLRIYRMPAYAPDLNPAEMSLPQCEFRRSSLAWLSGSLSFGVSIGLASSGQRRRLW